MTYNVLDVKPLHYYFFNHQLTPVSRSVTAPCWKLPITCGTGFGILFVFLAVRHRALLRRHTLILDRLLTFLVAFLFASQNFPFLKAFSSIAIYPFLGLIWNYDHS